MSYSKISKEVLEYLPGWYFDENQLKKISNTLDLKVDAGASIYPRPEEVYRCFYNMSPIDVKVVILGQDCYHTPGMADGLAFSTKQSRLPPSLTNIFKELKDDLGIDNTNGSLYNWKRQGVLLLNTALTVEKGKPGSHSKLWDGFAKRVITQLQKSSQPRVYILWGAHAQDCFGEREFKEDLVIRSAHPSPFSANKGFFGSKPFLKANDFLKEKNISQIDWSTNVKS